MSEKYNGRSLGPATPPPNQASTDLGLGPAGRGKKELNRGSSVLSPRPQLCPVHHLGEFVVENAFFGDLRPDTEAIVHGDEDFLRCRQGEIHVGSDIGDRQRPTSVGGQAQHLLLKALHESFPPIIEAFQTPPERPCARHTDHASNSDGSSFRLAQGHFDWRMALLLAPGIFVGAWIGARTMLRIDRNLLKKIFGVAMFLIASGLIVRMILG